MENLFSVNGIWGHLAYAAIALSYWLTSIYWLRVLAVIGLALEIIYFYFAGGDLAIGMGWSFIFVAINLYQLIWLIRERQGLKLPEADAPLLRLALNGLDDSQIARLLRAGDWKEYAAGDVLTNQDRPIDSLYFILDGRASVQVNKSFVTTLERGTFVGEIAYLTGNPATATVIVEEPLRALVFNRVKMAKVTASDDRIAGTIYELLGRDLAAKMRKTNTRRILTDNEEVRI